MYISSKPSVYCIDGSNLVRSFWSGHFSKDDKDTADFLDFLETAAQSQALCRSYFRVVFDGGYRPCGSLERGKVKVSFSEGAVADDMLLETAIYLKGANKRPVLVTSDGGLAENAKAQGVKTMHCPAFLSLCRRSAAMDSR